MIHLKRCALFILFLISLAVSNNSYAQTNLDSVVVQQNFINELSKRDSILLAAKQARSLDSLNRILERQKVEAYRDSMRMVMLEQRKQDSIKREEFKLKMLAERAKRDSIQTAQRAAMDSMIAARKHQSDSLRNARKAHTDSVSSARAEAKRKRDELRKYKGSKFYKDSVAQARQARKDSIAQVRDAKRELMKRARDEQLARIKAQRKKSLDSLKSAREAEARVVKAFQKIRQDSIHLARKNYNDSLKLARKTFNDSVKLARQTKIDSLSKVRGLDKIVAGKKKTETELLKQKADQIHARKQGSWTNEQLLKKSWNIKRRIWQNTVTRYNAYYNAKRKYDEGLKKLKERYKESFTEQISLYPYRLDDGLSAIGSEMDTVVKKCAYDTQIHDPRSKWFDNLYHLMGRAFYFKNDYESAITAFQYVVNEYKDGDFKKRLKKGYVQLPALNDIKFDKDSKIILATKEKRTGLKTLAHHPIRNEALIWLARAYTKNKQFGEAQSLLNILEEDKQFPERLRDDLYFALADLSFEQGNHLSAIDPLVKALKQKNINKDMRNRAHYLLAQLYAQDGNLDASNKYLKKALDSKLPLEMEYFTKLNLAQNAIAGQGNKESAIGQLESLSREDKFGKWRAQTYLSLGQILQESKPDEAIKNYNKSLAQANNKELQAHAFLGLSEIYYKRADYREAKTTYDSTAAFAKDANPPIKDLDLVKLRQEVLSSLVMYTDIIGIEDSLQALSRMSDKEKIAEIKKELRRQQKERRKQIEEDSKKLTAVTLTPGKFGQNDWYFYSNMNVQKGLVEFKTKWGDRPLADNWRRNSSQALGGNLLAENDSTNASGDGIDDLTRNAEINQMLGALYDSPKDFEESNDRIVDAYFQLGLIYSSRLQEYGKSIATYETLNQRFPKHKQLAATYYSMILSHTKLNQTAQANTFKQKLLTEFPNTQFTKLANGQSEKENIDYKKITTLYDSAYQMLARYEFSNALNNATASLSQYPENTLKPKFELVQAKSLAGLKKYDSSIVITENIIKAYPETEEGKYAQTFLGYLIKTTQMQLGIKEVINDTSKEASILSSIEKIQNNSAVYTFNKNLPHYYIIYLNQVDGNTIALKAGFSDYNRLKHGDKNLQTNMNLIDRNSAVLTIVEFKNADLAERYLKQARNEQDLFSKVQGINYKEMLITEANFKELLKTRKVEEYIQFYKEKY